MEPARQWFRFEGRREAPAESVPTGKVHGNDSVAMTNLVDTVVLAWHNLRAVLIERDVLVPGATTSGSAVFFLSVPVERYRDVSRCVLVVTDYSGRTSRHKLPIGPAFNKGIEAGLVLVDAPVRETGGIITWEGITLGRGST